MWWFIVGFIVSFFLAYAAMPKPQNAQLGTVDSPTAEEGRPIPVLFGTRWVKQTNVVWYGDISSTAVKKEGGAK